MDNNKYFAKYDSADLAEHLDSEFKSWRDKSGNGNLEERQKKALRYYFGNHSSTPGSGVMDAGPNGEFKVFGVNHFRNVIRHIMALTTAQRPVFDARARNTDMISMNRAKLANQVLDFYMEEKKALSKCEESAELGLVTGKSWVSYEWDLNMGRAVSTEPVVDDDSGEPVLDDDGEPVERIKYEGDVRAQTHSVFDVRTDSGCEDDDDLDWADVRVYRNKWELAAQYPKYRDEIINSSQETDYSGIEETFLKNRSDTTDYIPVFYFRHKKSPALPSGRYQIRLYDGVVLYDGPYPYGDRLNIFQIKPGKVFSSTNGYTDMFDVLTVQEVLNTLESAQFTNQEAFGVQMIAVTENSNVSPEQIDGKVFIKIPSMEDMPRAVQLTATPPEVQANIRAKESSIEKLSGINSVVRGEPDSNLKSGAALARVQSMAIQFNSNFQKSWIRLLEDSASFVLFLLSTFSPEERFIAVAGKKYRGAITSFRGEDLEIIESVKVDLGNPLSRTSAGKLEIGDRLLDKGLIKTPQQYLEVLETGNLETMTESETSQLELIRRENEDLREGKPVQAIVGDKNLLHMQEHQTILADPDIRRAAATGDQYAISILRNVTNHIMEHKNLYQSQDPIWSVITGEPPAPAPAPPMPPPGPPNAQGQGSQGGPQPGPIPSMVPPQGPDNMANAPQPNVPPMALS